MNDKNSEPVWPIFVFIFAVFLAFNYGGLWIGILAIVIGLPVLGWSKRHEGPFPVEKSSPRRRNEPTNVNSLVKQFTGRKFGELVLYHHNKQDLQAIVTALQGTIEHLPQRARPSVESWVDEINPFGTDSVFWQRDCGEVFTEITDLAREKLANYEIHITDEHLLDMFQIIVLSFAYTAHKHPQSKIFIQKSLTAEVPDMSI